jgi:hypothetical protein
MPIITNPVPIMSKEKKPKGLFKPPQYPHYVLRPRARVTAPTPSTALDTSAFPAQADNDPPTTTTTATVQPPDSKAAKALTARRAKELEREAKEKEYADGQHANMIDGVWHCSNCGCPESIAVGRRKGPLGDKSQCGPCGMPVHSSSREEVLKTSYLYQASSGTGIGDRCLWSIILIQSFISASNEIKNLPKLLPKRKAELLHSALRRQLHKRKAPLNRPHHGVVRTIPG